MGKHVKPDILIFGSSGWSSAAEEIEKKANVHRAELHKPGEASALLRKFPLAWAILITDMAIMQFKHKKLSRDIINYVKNCEGTVILACGKGRDEIDRWFRDSWGKSWKVGQEETRTVNLQDSHVGLLDSDKSKLSKSYSPKAIFLQYVSSSDSLYASLPSTRNKSTALSRTLSPELATSIAFGRCGKGQLAYIGDQSIEPATVDAMLAMMKLLA